MKKSVLSLLGLILALIPMGAKAQSNIQAAFKAIIKCNEAQITSSYTLEKDPDTQIKSGQSEVYDFVLPAKKMKLVDDVLAAFEKDKNRAFTINSGNATYNANQIHLAIGNGVGPGVYINEPGYEYIYALFLAPKSEDKDGIYRYAYALSYKKDGKNIVGKLVITYATTLKYRQQVESERQYNMLRSFSNSANAWSDNDTQQSWFDTLMTYFQSMPSSSSQTRVALASKAYKVISNQSQYTDITAADKEAVRDILKGMIADKTYSETVLRTLLNRCLKEIK